MLVLQLAGIKASVFFFWGIPRFPVRQFVLSFPIPLHGLFAIHPELLAPVLQIIHRAIATFLIERTRIRRDVIRARTVAIDEFDRLLWVERRT